jgi:hypothetical protein
MNTSTRGRLLIAAGALATTLTCLGLAGAFYQGREAAAQRGSVDVFLPLVARHWATDVVAPDTRVEVEAQYGGRSWAVAVDGDTAYLGLGATLAVADVSDPDTPVIVGRSEVLPGVVKGLDVDRGYVFATVDDRYQITGRGGLYTFDVRDPQRPRLASRLFMESGGEGVAVEDGFAYVVSGPMPDMRSTGLRIVDVSRPSRLVQVGRLMLDGNYAHPVLAGDRLYVGANIVDVSDRGRPRLVGALAPPHYGWVVGAAADDRHVYVLGYPVKLSVLDLTDPEHAIEVGVTALDEEISPLLAAVGDDLVFVTGYTESEPRAGRVQVVDVGNPAAPRLAAVADTPGIGLGVAAQGTVALATQNFGHVEIFEHDSEFVLGGGLQVVDAKSAEVPSVRGSIRRPGGFVSAVDVSDRSVWFAEGYFRWYVFGTVFPRLWSLGDGDRDRPAPGILGSIELNARPIDLAIDAGVALTAYERYPVQAIDVGDATNPTLVGPIGVTARTVAAQDHVLLATVPEREAIVTVDVSDPSAPRELGSLSYETRSKRAPIALESAHGWISWAYIDVVDVSDPSQPNISAVLPIQDRFTLAVDVDVEHAFVAAYDLTAEPGEEQRLMILDARSLGWPRVISEVTLPTEGGNYGYAQDVAVSGDRAWVAMSSGAVFLVDVADSANPRVVDRIDKPAYIHSVLPDTVWQHGAIKIRAADDRAYVAYDPGGLVVLRAIER